MRRKYRYDNIKAFLIFCVVFGHLIEGSGYDVMKMLYILIYSFHMPLFVFLSGMFARFDTRKIMRRLVLPYVVFQTIYCAVHIGERKLIAYTTPVWVLWYLLSLIVWYLLVPFLEGGGRRRLAVLAGSVLVALLAGYDATVGYWMSASRTVVFFPFFAAGYYYGHSDALQSAFEGIRAEYLVIPGGVAALGICFAAKQIDSRWLYGSYSYTAAGGSFWYRLGFLLCGGILGAAIFKLFPERRTPLSAIGRHTMPVYLLHGLLVPVLRGCLFEQFRWNENQELVLALACSVLIVWILGRDWNTLIQKGHLGIGCHHLENG